MPLPYMPPMPPALSFYLSKNGIRLLKWETPVVDQNLNVTTVTSYKIYRSTNANMETFACIATITTKDMKGNVDTMFSETIQGFTGYQITALNSYGESAPTLALAVDSTVDLDIL